MHLLFSLLQHYNATLIRSPRSGEGEKGDEEGFVQSRRSELIDPSKLIPSGQYYGRGVIIAILDTGVDLAIAVGLLSNVAQISLANRLGYLCSIRWGADFILRAHTSPSTFYTQVGDGNSDHQCWERPEDKDTPQTLF
ncbi:hypothetical protein NE237_028452 [Protea cynaroides]|uniref:cellulase n=1 Tax=Protea cynaroides TaxID=273540 RepID=A0A9Q0JV59_9MAGN|nr:hypothetical protein NE237_028452 [Protea cynaroides]